ncbi:MAG TPA: glycosyltransferase family 39 protein [Candidatus Saccharimonadales bacterium]|nr:glycosyltransferase family 39 protein [Candidatus Saccharimonadales bacterium]
MFNASWRRFFELKLSLPLMIIVALGIVVTLWHIGSSPAYLSPDGASARAASSSLTQIYHHPVNLPHKLVLFGVSKLSTNLTVLRLASYIAGIIFAISFYKLSKGLFGKMVGFLSTMIFCLSPFFVIPGRRVSASILLFAPVAIMALYAWFIRTEKKSAAWLALMIAAGLLAYTPGIILWMIGAAVIYRKKLAESIQLVPAWMVGAGTTVFLLLLIPAIVSIFHDWRSVETYLLVPAHWAAPLTILKNFGLMIMALFIQTPHNDVLMLGRLPVLDVIQTALVVFGSFALWIAAPKKVYAYVAAMLFAVAVAAVNNDTKLLFLGLAPMGLLMAAGLRYLYVEWRAVFPRNPIAKSLALLCMVVLVAVQLLYGLRYSLQAWPDTQATKNTYVIK